MNMLAGWPRLVESAGEEHEPHPVLFNLYDVAAAFHGRWSKSKDDASVRFLSAAAAARFALVQAAATSIRPDFEIMGVTPVEEMR